MNEQCCASCGHLNENYKDWDNPAFTIIYVALSKADEAPELDGIADITTWLNRNGFANLTCCPICHVDDFTHVEGCPFDKPPMSNPRKPTRRLRSGEAKTKK